MDAGEPRLAVGVVSLAAPDLLDRCLASVLAQRNLWAVNYSPDVAVVMNGPSVAEVCARWEHDRSVSVHRPGRNLGTCASWNRLCRWAWRRGAGGMLLLNDDMVLTDPETLGKFLAVYAESGWRQMRFVMARGFSAVCVTRAVWDEIGEFDEGYWPAYYEDNDYWRRFHLRGIAWDHVMVDSLHEGSATLGRSADLQALNGTTFSLNGDRYRAKWGALPLQGEPYTEPWNGGQPTPGTRELVSADVRARIEAAYGEADDSW